MLVVSEMVPRSIEEKIGCINQAFALVSQNGKILFADSQFWKLCENRYELEDCPFLSEIINHPVAVKLQSFVALVIETGQTQRFVECFSGRILIEFSVFPESINAAVHIRNISEMNVDSAISALQADKGNAGLFSGPESMLGILSDASEILSSSLDYTQAFEKLTNIVIPGFADWYTIDILNDEGGIDLLFLQHRNKELVPAGYELRVLYPMDPNANAGVGNVLRTSRPELYSILSRESIIAASHDENHATLLTQLGVSSLMILPMIRSGKPVGAISFYTNELSGRYFNEADVVFAQELTNRISLALENIRLFQSAQLELEERKKVQSVLEEKEKQLSIITANIPALVAYVDKDLFYKYVNSTYERWFGESKFVSKHLKDVIGQKAFEKILPKIREVLNGNEISFETEIPYLNGGARTVEAKYTPDFDPSGKIRGYIELVNDISESIRNKKELQEFAERLKTKNNNLRVLNTIGKALSAELDLSNIVEAVTAASTEISGAEIGAFYLNNKNEKGEFYLLHSLTGAGREEFKSFSLPDNPAFFHSKFSSEGIIRIHDLAVDPRFNSDNENASGRLKIRSLLIIPVISKSGIVYGSLFLCHSHPDIFNSKSEDLVTGIASQASVAMDNARLFEARQQSEERFRFLAESMPQMVWTARPDGFLDYCNKKWIEYTGLSQAETGLNWWKALHPDDVATGINAWHEAIETGVRLDNEFRIKRNSDGTFRWYVARALPQRDKNGNITKWFGTCTDIHDQKMLNEKKDEFIGIASHELKTPLTSVKAYVQLMERTLADREDKVLHAYVSKANTHINRLNDLISDLLDVSRIQAGKMQFNYTRFSLDDFISESVESLQNIFPSHKIEISGKSKAVVFADKNRIDQVITNFVSNAVKYSPSSGKVQILLSVSGDNTRIGVKDFGIGIPKNQLNYVFDRFFRAAEVRMKFNGLGIGLYISHEIIKRHSGKAWVESEEGKGSVFYFTLPVHN